MNVDRKPTPIDQQPELSKVKTLAKSPVVDSEGLAFRDLKAEEGEARKRDRDKANEIRISLGTEELPESNLEQLAESVIRDIESIDGVTITDRQGAIIFLTSTSVLNDRGGFPNFLECDPAKKNIERDLVTLRSNKDFNRRWGQILKTHLINEQYKTNLLSSKTDLIQHNKIRFDKWKTEIDTADLNSPEITALGIDGIKQIMEKIIDNEGGAVEQGMFWNTLISKDLPYVIKTEREVNQHETVRRALMQYSIVKNIFGVECLPKQAVLESHDPEQMVVVQEKLDLGKMTPLSNGTIDAFVSGEYGQKIRAALEKEENRQKMKIFIANIRRLSDKHNLILDTLGENIYFRVNDDGDLEIKIADYGCFEKENGDDHAQDVDGFLRKIEILIKKT